MASSKREKELARMRAERQAARRAAAAARRRQRNLVIASVVAVALVALGGIVLATKIGGTSTAAPKTSPSASTAASLAPGTCKYTPTKTAASRKVDLPPETGVETKQAFTVHLTTNLGLIDIQLNSAAAPCTANNFRSLVHFKYFNNTPCHRLTTQGIYVLQCGDPSGKGTGGPGYTFGDENLKGAKYPKGTVAMANSGPGTNGSQFFLVYKDTQLDPNYTPFGTITKGLDIIDKVAAAGSVPTGDGKPKLAINILSARFEPTKA
ncbi:MAG: putative peptidyl-prolyl cis-trans isomerase cyclophilin type [Frankiales bacterium]|nr:putative peptidyl-prolyl cis-trans isomerase cyclophilin type [Frankiales bacterium]